MNWDDFYSIEGLWVLIGLLLLIAEMIAPGAYLMFIGGAAILTGILGLTLSLPHIRLDRALQFLMGDRLA